MPYTFNGIGTMYYGKRNREAYHGVCDSCNRAVELSNYETGHWFVFLFIPVIPLGRKQILADCSHCRRHRVVSVAEWRKISDEGINEGMSALRENPDSPEAAITTLHTLVAFRKHDTATTLAEGLPAKFPESAEIHLEVGSWFAELHRDQEAADCFKKAFELDPNNLDAKRALAVSQLVSGDPVSMRRFLQEEPAFTAEHDPSLYVALGKALHEKGLHPEAVDVYREVMAAVPEAGRDKELRRLIQTAERASGLSGSSGSILPEIPWHRRPAILWPGIAAALLIAAVAINYWIASRRTLFITNGFSVPMTVALDEGAPREVPSKGWISVPVAEGAHVAAIRVGELPEQRETFDVESGVASRFFRDPCFVLNPGGGSVIVWQQATYSSVPAPEDENAYHAHVGEPFVTYDDVDYAFREFPRELRMKSKKVTKTRVGVQRLDPSDIFGVPPEVVPIAAQLAFAEAHLKVAPDDRTLLQIYTMVGSANDAERCETFLRAGLDARPVQVEWHRTYHMLHKIRGTEDELLKEYRALAEAEPQSARLKYLQGRLEPRTSVASECYRKAISLDPRLSYAWFAQSFARELSGDLAGAEQACEKAVQIDPEKSDFRERWWRLRGAGGDWAGVEKELRDAQIEKPYDRALHSLLLEAITAQNRPGDVRDAQNLFEQSLSTLDEGEAAYWRHASRIRMHYLLRDFLALLSELEGSEDAAPDMERFRALVEAGRLPEAARFFEPADVKTDGYPELCLSIGYTQQGDSKEAGRWYARAIERLAAGPAEKRAAAEVLRKGTGAGPADLTFHSMPSERAILLVALAQQDSDHRDDFLARAAKLNHTREFPYHLLNRASEIVNQR